MSHSLCEGPLAPFTIQQAGSTTSPMIDRGPVFAAGASAGMVAGAFAAFVVALAAAGAGALAGAGLAGVTCTVPVVVLPWARARAGVQDGSRARTRSANVIRVFIQNLHGIANGRVARLSIPSLTEYRDRPQEARPARSIRRPFRACAVTWHRVRSPRTPAQEPLRRVCVSGTTRCPRAPPRASNRGATSK